MLVGHHRKYEYSDHPYVNELDFYAVGRFSPEMYHMLGDGGVFTKEVMSHCEGDGIDRIV